jgi:predicted aminopeptidase
MARMVTKLRLILVLASCLAVQGCGTLYIAQAATGQLQLLSARKPIDRVLANPKSSPELKPRL